MYRVSISQYGARQDGTVQTRSIQQAIDDCFLRGGGEVCIPKGVYVTGGLRLRSGVTLRLLAGAVLQGSCDPQDYLARLEDALEPLGPEDACEVMPTRYGLWNGDCFAFMYHAASRWNNALICAIRAHDIAIVGEAGAVIDGQDCFDALGEECYRGPHGIRIFACRNVTLQGYTLRNSANWAHAVYATQRLTVEKVRVEGGHDGINLRSCDDVRIADCVLHCGDDCIAGDDNCRVTVSRCEMNTACSAFRYGGTHTLIEDCTFFGPAEYLFRGSLSEEEKRSRARVSPGGRRNMLCVFTYFSDPCHPVRHQPGDLVMRRCTARCADRFLLYNYSGSDPLQNNRPLADLTLEDVDAADIKEPLVAYGAAALPFSLCLRRVRVAQPAAGAALPFLRMAYTQAMLKEVQVENTAHPAVLVWEGDDPALHGVKGLTAQDVVRAAVPFEAQRI